MPDNVNNFYLRDFRLPHKADLQQVRLKFQGYARFIINRAILFSDYTKGLNVGSGVSSLIRTASLPEVKFKTDVKNQYNRKKIINTGVDYSPVTIKLLDTAWNESLDLIMRYYAYNYMNVRNFDGTSRYDLKYQLSSNAENINSAFKTESFNSNLTGYNINTSRYFFERIDYVLYSGQKGVQYSIFNPVLSGFTTGEIDYGSSDPLEFDLTFDYENFTIFQDVNFDLSNIEKLSFEDVSYANQMQLGFLEGVDSGKITRKITGLGSSQSPQNRSPQPRPKLGIEPEATEEATEESQDTSATEAQIYVGDVNINPDIAGTA